MKKIKGKIGLGSLSLVLTIMGILFSGSVGGYPCLGDSILNFIGLKPWGGFHYTILYSLLFFIPSVILAYTHKNDIGARLGGVMALILGTPPLTIIVLMIFDLLIGNVWW